MGSPDVEMGATHRFVGSRMGPEVEPSGGYEPAKLGSLRIITSQLSPRDAMRSSATGAPAPLLHFSSLLLSQAVACTHAHMRRLHVRAHARTYVCSHMRTSAELLR